MSQFDLLTQVKCVEREIAMRRRVFPRFVASGKMTQQKANEEIACMEAVLATIIGLEAAGRLV